jgi:hypothetical protein
MEILAISLWQKAIILKGTKKIHTRRDQTITRLADDLDKSRFFKHCFQVLEIYLSFLPDEHAFFLHGLSHHHFQCKVNIHDLALSCFPTIYRLPIIE